MKRHRARSAAAAIAAFLATTSPLAARQSDKSPSGGYHLELRLGALATTEGSDRFDTVFGGAAPGLGLGLERRFDRWLLRFEAGRASWRGHESLVVHHLDAPSEGPLPSSSQFSALLAGLTVARRFPVGGVWEVYGGGGPSALAWEDENLLRHRDGGAWGGHLTLGARRPVGSWTVGGELTYTRILDLPDDLGGEGEGMVEADLGLLALDLTASYGFWPGGGTEASDIPSLRFADHPTRFAVRAAAFYVHPTASYTRSFGIYGPGGTLVSRQDDDYGWGAGLELRLAGPWSLVAQTFRATVGSSSSVTTRQPEGDFVVHASGSIDVEGVTVAAALDLWRGRRARVSLGPLWADLSYVGVEDGDYRIGIDRNGQNLGAFVGLEVRLVAGLGAVVDLEHLALVRLDGFDSGFQLYPWVLSTGLSYRW